MTADVDDNFLAMVDPVRLTGLLEESGWRIVGRRRGSYNRLAPPGDPESSWGSSILVPLDSGAPDFQFMLLAVIAELQSPQYGDIWTRRIIPRLVILTADELRFRKETNAPKGLIPWRQGEELLQAARGTLIAGAKFFLEPRRRFANKYGTFASRYLDKILMGQTAIGSYVVTAYIPALEIVPIVGTSSAEQTLSPHEQGEIYPEAIESLHGDPSESPNGRAVTKSVIQALDATVEALQHYRSTGSLSAFEAGVSEGISFDLTSALEGLTKGASESGISIEWDSGSRGQAASTSEIFEFYPADSQALSRAKIVLAADTENTREVAVVGRVHLLTKKEAGGPGVFGMELIGGAVKHVRVRLDDGDQYHQAVRAHDDDLAIRVSGRLQRDGNLYWLYSAFIDGVEGSVVEIRERFAHLARGELHGQQQLDRYIGN